MAQITRSALDLGSQRHLFEVPDDVVYLNTASLGPQLRAVRIAGESALERRAAPWKIRSGDWFSDVETLRALFAARRRGAFEPPGRRVPGAEVTRFFALVVVTAN